MRSSFAPGALAAARAAAGGVGSRSETPRPPSIRSPRRGIAKALRSGIFASYAIGDLLVNGDESGVARYRSFVADDFESYSRRVTGTTPSNADGRTVSSGCGGGREARSIA